MGSNLQRPFLDHPVNAAIQRSQRTPYDHRQASEDPLLKTLHSLNPEGLCDCLVKSTKAPRTLLLERSRCPPRGVNDVRTLRSGPGKLVMACSHRRKDRPKDDPTNHSFTLRAPLERTLRGFGPNIGAPKSTVERTSNCIRPLGVAGCTSLLEQPSEEIRSFWGCLFATQKTLDRPMGRLEIPKILVAGHKPDKAPSVELV